MCVCLCVHIYAYVLTYMHLWEFAKNNASPTVTLARLYYSL